MTHLFPATTPATSLPVPPLVDAASQPPLPRPARPHDAAFHLAVTRPSIQEAACPFTESNLRGRWLHTWPVMAFVTHCALGCTDYPPHAEASYVGDTLHFRADLQPALTPEAHGAYFLLDVLCRDKRRFAVLDNILQRAHYGQDRTRPQPAYTPALFLENAQTALEQGELRFGQWQPGQFFGSLSMLLEGCIGEITDDKTRDNVRAFQRHLDML